MVFERWLDISESAFIGFEAEANNEIFKGNFVVGSLAHVVSLEIMRRGQGLSDLPLDVL